MPNLANINVSITATDNTGPGVSSAKNNLSSLGGVFGSVGTIASGVLGGILGAATFRTIASGIGSIVSGAFSLNNRLAESRAASRSMVDALAESEPVGTGAFGALSKAAESFARTVREIREREADGLADYSQRIDDVKQRILDAQQQQAAASAKAIADQKAQLADLAQDHQRSIEDLNTSLANNTLDYNERIYDMANSRQDKLDNLEDGHANKVENINKKLVDAQEELLTASTAFDQARAQAKIDSLNAQLAEENNAYAAEIIKINERADHEVQVTTDKYNREQAALQLKISREEADYTAQQAKIKARADEQVKTAEDTANKQVASLQKQLAQQEVDHKRFLRDIQQAYEDANVKLEQAGSGGGGGGKRTINFQFDFADSFREMKATEIDKFLDDVQRKYVEIGVKSPFNVGDIQNFGKAVIGYTGGSATNMEKLVNMAQSLAARNPMQGMLGATTAMVELLGSGNITSLARRFDIPKASLEALSSAKNETEFITLLNEALERNGINMGLVEAKTHTLGGSFENLKETFNLVTAQISLPVWQFLTDKLVALNEWLFKNQDQINAFTNTLGELVNAIMEAVIPVFMDLFKQFSIFWEEISPEIIKTLKYLQTYWTNHSAEIMSAVKVMWSTIQFTITLAIDIIKGVVKIGLALIRGDWEGVWSAIKKFGEDTLNNFSTFVKNIWDAIGMHIRNGINSIIDKINDFTGKLNGIKAKVGNVDIGFNIPSIPRLAKGGLVTSPTLAMIGEAGPEAVVPLSGGKNLTGDINVYVTGNTILDDNTASILADKVGKVFVNQLQLQGRYT